MQRSIAFVVFDDLQILDLTGPLEVFASTNRLVSPPPYRLQVLSADGRPVRSTSGLVVGVDGALGTASAPDTLVVCGGEGARAAVVDERMVQWIRTSAPRCRRVTSVCSGSFLLARAGVIDGRRATTHWSVCDLLARSYPAVSVDPDPIFVRDGDVWTSAGVTAGMDLALALVEDDLGPEVTRRVARQLVLFVQRPGGQAQFSSQLAARRPESGGLRQTMAHIAEHPDDDLSVSRLAERAGMSPRTFARTFARQVGVTPAAYVERSRLESARHLLETTDTTVAVVARRCGFGRVETLHRAFQRHLGTTPAQYRHHHRAPVVRTRTA